ncbi:MAG: site-specific DNA-methyltransferase [Lachnospiraceae bacterium]|nr:site-specific DNA-methyltransferase [Lachnospiraceae bacterium]
MDKMKMETENITKKNVDMICELFPNCTSESVDKDGKIVKTVNFELLKQMLSEHEIETEERYEFTWVGKKKAILEANRPIRKTLRPCPEESIDWDKTENVYIEGDNLEALKLLQESYLGSIKVIYIDPPYNTGSDFVYRDNFHISMQEYREEYGITDEEGNHLFKNTDTNGRFHSDWCSMMYSRLLLARNLLREDGVIFISIDDNELDNLKKICDEIFGAGNFIANMIWQSTAGSNTGTDIVTVTENILIYTKKRNAFTFNGMLSDERSYTLSDEYESERGKYALDKLDRRRVAGHYSDALNYGIEMPDGSVRYPGGGSEKSTEGWNYLWSKSKVQWGIENGFIEFKQTNGQWNVYNKRYSKIDNEGKPVERTIPFRNLITSDQCNTAQGTAELRSIFGFRPFDFPKPSSLIKHLLLTAVRKDRDAIVLDFFSGSATTAHAVMQLNADDGGNRKFMLVQLPEETSSESEAHENGYRNICEIGKARIRKVGEQITSSLNDRDIDAGFRVFKVDDSNMSDVYYSAGEYNQDMLSMLESNIRPDRTELDLLFGCLLEWGLPLSMPYISEQLGDCIVHTYNNGDLVACFDKNIPDYVIKEIAKRQPLRAVFRDSSFDGSPAKINVGEIFKMLAPDTRVKVI